MLNRKPNTICEQCKVPIYRKPVELTRNKGRAFCSNKCYAESRKRYVPCRVCKTPILSGKQKKTCSKDCLQIYNNSEFREHCLGRKKVIDQYSLGTRTFRTIFLRERGFCCEECGYDKKEILNIHHIVEKQHGGSDEPSNLKLLCRNCHGEVHAGLRTLN